MKVGGAVLLLRVTEGAVARDAQEQLLPLVRTAILKELDALEGTPGPAPAAATAAASSRSLRLQNLV